MWDVYQQLAVICLAGCLYLAAIRATALSAAGLFAVMQMVMAIGTFPMLDPAVEADVVYGWVLTWSMLSYLLISSVVLLHGRGALTGPDAVTLWRPSFTTWLLVITMALGIFVYFRAVGYSAFLEGLRGITTGEEVDVATLRLNSYSGDQYFAPGIVNQFKNALLPALAVLILTYRRSAGVKRRLTTLLLVAASVFGLLGTGQRGAFIVFALVLIAYAYLSNLGRLPRWAWRAGLGALTLVILATIVLGRGADELAHGGPWWGRIEIAIAALKERVFVEQQASALAGFRFIYEQDVQNGREWIQSLSGVTPWSRGSDLSHRIFFTMYGSTRGTAPPSVWGSVYHNFGWAGVIGFAPTMAVLLGWVSRRGLAPRRRNTMEIMGISGVFVTLGTWVADTPLFLLNAGLVVYTALWWWGARSASADDEAMRRPVAASHQSRQTNPIPVRDDDCNVAFRGADPVSSPTQG